MSKEAMQAIKQSVDQIFKENPPNNQGSQPSNTA